MKNKIVAIVGPTGSGKTLWARKLASLFNGKIISADSRQIYRGMDIGTGKEKNIPQDLIDIAEPSENYSVADYQKTATKLINEYLAMNSLPILAGGTGLYIDSVLYGYVIPELKEESAKLRKELEKLKDSEILAKLKDVDPLSAQRIDPHNRRRILRALEVSMLLEKPFSSLQKRKKPKFKTLILGINTDRETLYSKIDARIDQMIRDGLVEEVRKLLEKYPSDLPSLNTIGYKEIVDYIKGITPLKEAVTKIKTNTHAYVRRQETWFKKNKEVKWVSSLDEAESLVRKFLKS